MKLIASVVATAAVLASAHLGAIYVTSSMVDNKITEAVKKAEGYISHYFESVQAKNGDIRPAYTLAVAHGDSSLLEKKATLVINNNYSGQTMTLPLHFDIGALNFTVRIDDDGKDYIKELGLYEIFEDLPYSAEGTDVDSALKVVLFPFSTTLDINLTSRPQLEIAKAQNIDKYPLNASVSIKSYGENDLHISADFRHFFGKGYYVDRLTFNNAYAFEDNDLSRYRSIEPLNVFVDGFYTPAMDFDDIVVEELFYGDIREYCMRNSQIKKLVLKQNLFSFKDNSFSAGFDLTANQIFSQKNVNAHGVLSNIPLGLFDRNSVFEVIEQLVENKLHLNLKHYRADVRYIAQREDKKLPSYASVKTRPVYDDITVEGSGTVSFDASVLGINANLEFEADRGKMEEMKSFEGNLVGLKTMAQYFEGRDKKATLKIEINDNSVLLNGKTIN